MRKLLLKVSAGPDHSFSVTEEECQHFYGDYHYHPEFELTYVIKGHGTRFVGDSIEPFSSGDLVFIGSDLPHLWKSDLQKTNTDAAPKSKSIAVHFNRNFLGEQFFKLPEMGAVNDLLHHAFRGLKIEGKAKAQVSKLLVAMTKKSNTEKLLLLMEILHLLSTSKELLPLTSTRFTTVCLPDDSIRIKNVYQYVISNFRRPIKLDEAAKAANMSPTAFCRYFKQRTRKNFSTFVNEVRVSYACRLLQDESKKMAEVCYESGFGNLSNFNKQFKSMIRLTPMQYVKTGIGKNR